MKKPSYSNSLCRLLPALGLLAMAASAQAQLVNFTFPVASHDVSDPATTTAGGVTASDITHVNLGVGAGNINFNGYLGVGGDGHFTTGSSYNLTSYLSFTVTPQLGYEIEFQPTDTLTFNVGIQDTGTGNPGGVDVMYSTDGFVTSTDLGSTAVTTAVGESVSLNLTTLPLVSGTTGEFRFYFDGAPNPYETGSIGNIVLNGITIQDTPPSVPEPTSTALVLGGLAALALGLRRRMVS